MYGFRDIGLGLCKVKIRIVKADATLRVLEFLNDRRCLRSNVTYYNGRANIEVVMEIELYNAMQECIKHARASRKIVELSQEVTYLEECIDCREKAERYAVTADDLPL